MRGRAQAARVFEASLFARGGFAHGMSAHLTPTVLHYSGADNDGGGIVSVVRALAASGRFACVLGVSPGFKQRRVPPLSTLSFPRVTAEIIGVKTWWRTWAVAREVRAWLAADPTRIFHAHSRAGLLVALHLTTAGEPRVVASVHCYGRQRWFYRHAQRRLGHRLFWLSPAMKRHYEIPGEGWAQCIPGSVTEPPAATGRPRPRAGAPLSLGGVGLLVAWKGWHDVLEALAALPAHVRDQVSFRHIGSPDTTAASQAYARQLYERTAALGLQDRVTWLGEQPNSEGFLGTVDALVLPSRSEPLSMALLEALRAGVPVLAADSGGPLDLLQPGETGWFFRTGDVADLTRSITTLATTDALDRVVITPDTIRPFTAPVIAARWAEVYAGLPKPTTASH